MFDLFLVDIVSPKDFVILGEWILHSLALEGVPRQRARLKCAESVEKSIGANQIEARCAARGREGS